MQLLTYLINAASILGTIQDSNNEKLEEIFYKINKVINSLVARKIKLDTGCPQKRRRVHNSVIYRKILIICTPN
jgi:hypothetical protein